MRLENKVAIVTGGGRGIGFAGAQAFVREGARVVVAEIVRRVVEECFDDLDSPPTVLGGANLPVPFSPPLEQACIPQTATIAAAVRSMCL